MGSCHRRYFPSWQSQFFKLIDGDASTLSDAFAILPLRNRVWHLDTILRALFTIYDIVSAVIVSIPTVSVVAGYFSNKLMTVWCWRIFALEWKWCQAVLTSLLADFASVAMFGIPHFNGKVLIFSLRKFYHIKGCQTNPIWFWSLSNAKISDFQRTNSEFAKSEQIHLVKITLAYAHFRA
jgi:hypothetical protein